MTMPVSGGDANRNANVTLSADISGYSQNMQAATQQTNVLSRAVDTLSEKLDGITRKAGKKLIQFSAGDAVSLGAVTASAAAFERQLGTLRVTADLSNQSFKDLKNGVESTFVKFPVARGQVIELTNAISNMGVTGTKNIGDLTQTFIKLGAATGESMSGLAQGLIQVSRQMGNTNTTQIGNYANALLTVSKNAGVSASSVLTFANNIAPMARAAGIGEAAVLGISTAFSKAGADGFVGANAFNKIIGDINQDVATGSPDLAKYANLIGMTTDQFKQADKGKAFVQIIQAISKGGPEAINTLNRLGIDGVRAQSALQALAQSGDLQAQVNKAVGASNDQGNLNKGARDAMSGLSDELAKLRNNFTQFGTEIGTSFLTPLEKVVSVLNRLFDVMNAIIKPFAPLVAGLGAVAGALGAIGGVGLLAAGAITKIALARTIIGGTPIIAARQGFAVGRDPNVVNQSAQRMASGQLNWYQRRFFQAGAGVGSLFPVAPGGSPNTGLTGMQRLRNAAIATPFRAVNTLALATQTRFLQQSQLNGYDRTPVVGVRGAAQATGAILRNPVAAFRGARASSDETSAFAKSIKAAGTSVTAMRAAAASAVSSISRSSIANVEGAKASQVAAREAGVLAAAFGKLAVQTVATGATQVGQGAAYAGGKLLRGAGSLLGGLGPIGIASIGIPLAIGLQQSINKKDRADFEVTGYNNIDKYNQALGVASDNLAHFSNAVNDAANASKGKALGTPTTLAGAAKISAEDAAANTSGYKVKDTTFKAIAQSGSSDAAVAYIQELATGQSGGLDPARLQAIKGDVLNAFGPQQGQQILNQYLKQNPTASPTQAVNFGALSPALSKTYGSNNYKSIVGNSLGAIQSQNQLNSLNQGGKYASGVELQQLLGLGNTVLSGDNGRGRTFGGKQLAGSLATILGGKASDYKFSTSENSNLDEGALKNIYGSDTGRQVAILNALQNSPNGASLLNSLGVTPSSRTLIPGGDKNRASDYRNEFTQSDIDKFLKSVPGLASPTGSAYNQQVTAGGSLGKFSLASQTVKTAVAQPGDTNAQYAAIKTLSDEALRSGRGLAGATEQLDRLKTAIQDTTDPLYQLAENARLYAQRQQSYITPTLSVAAQGQQLKTNLAAANRSTAPDAQQLVQQAQDAYQQGKEQQRQYLVSLYQQAQQYGTQMERANQDENQSIARSNADFFLSQLYAQEDFNKSRVRSERDFGIQMQRQTQQVAKSIYDPYSQVQSKYTSDAGSLELNLEDQNRRIQQQRAQLAKVSRMGLSQQAIDTLQLADPNSAQQLNSLVDGLTNDPALIKKINQQVQARLQGTKSLTQNAFSDSYRNTLADFTRASKDAEIDFNTARNRSVAAQQLALDRQAADFNKMVKRSAADLKTSMTEIYGSFADLFPKTLDMVNKNIGRYAPDAAKLIGDQLAKLKAVYFPDGTIIPINIAGADAKLTQAQLNAKYGWGGHALGGVSTQEHLARVSEHNKAEAIIPLDQRGQNYMAGMYYAVARSVVQQMQTGAGMKVVGQAPAGNQTFHIDSSTNFTGNITVQAQDPKAMQAALEQQKRILKLTRPTRSTVNAT